MGLLDRVPADVFVVIDERYRKFITETGMDETRIQASVVYRVGLPPNRPNACVVRTLSHA
ncbi:hypothetical protein AB0L75_24240 [Streptomyces sp. NPDC052101]|uniref:hypothetical protein n=1 Tax=Streptomyces sp. NPDC052101 TaxID=3155763 RepID=UPI003439E9B5